ncbi:MAG: thermonuclease family protein [Hyphomicrobiaceae bacterium]|nr:thermonuclease family protein [Hyphomicrobiaceae bacterium]
MFFWRRKNDGFEWHKYVRTTIKLRRNERRKRIDQIKHDAAQRVKEAGQAGASASRAGAALAGTGLSALGAWLLRLPGYIAWGLGTAWHGLVMLVQWLWRGAGPASAAIISAFAGLTDLIRRPGLAPLLGGAAVAAIVFVAYRLLAGGPQSEALGGVVLAIVLALIAVVALVDRRPLENAASRLTGPFRSIPYERLLPARKYARPLAIVAIGLLIGAGGWIGVRSLWGSGAPSLNPAGLLAAVVPSGTETVKGRARAISGDQIRVAGQIVQLSGIEAPELAQTCRNARGRIWSCGIVARRLLARLTGNRAVTCEVQNGSSGAARAGQCKTAAGKDLAELMVSRGYAFATGTIFASYASAENTAREQKLGVWRGRADKPSDYRARRWAAAKRTAPDGCPIKGRVVRARKLYVLPWARAYTRVRLRKDRGERWFCSEADAIAAGWKPAISG